MRKGKETRKIRETAGKKLQKPKAPKKRRTEGKQKTRLWLMYPPRLITLPIIWQLGHKFELLTNVRQASATGEIGIVCLELEGVRSEIHAAIKWLEKRGVRVEPVEISVVES